MVWSRSHSLFMAIKGNDVITYELMGHVANTHASTITTVAYGFWCGRLFGFSYNNVIRLNGSNRESESLFVVRYDQYE